MDRLLEKKLNLKHNIEQLNRMNALFIKSNIEYDYYAIKRFKKEIGNLIKEIGKLEKQIKKIEDEQNRR